MNGQKWEFLLRVDKTSASPFQRVRQLPVSEVPNYLFLGKNGVEIKPNMYLVGDNELNSLYEYAAVQSNPERVRSLRGLFYLIILNDDGRAVRVFNPMFSILPVYTYESVNEIIVSSTVRLIDDGVRNLAIDKNYVLQRSLFNYSLFDTTIYKEVKLLRTNYFLEVVRGRIHNIRHTDIADFFVNNAISYRKSIESLTQLFVRTVDKYVPQSGASISFTSGFDGRSLVAVSKHLRKDFSTYSFGTERNEDLWLPRTQSEALGLPFVPINLDVENYYRQFWTLSIGAIERSYGATDFLQTHWSYSAKLLSDSTRTAVSGLFGSELFRSAHLAGQFISPALFNYFKNFRSDKWIAGIMGEARHCLLNLHSFHAEMKELLDGLQDYKNKLLGLTPSQSLYKYVFDEIFRKFFGLQLLFPQLEYINVVTPYLDFEFFQEVLKTQLAAVNAPLFTENPMKRFRGQIFHAKLMALTLPGLLELSTGKGYRPKDLLSTSGKARIAHDFISRRMKRRLGRVDLDNLGIISSYEFSRDKFERIEIDPELFDEAKVNVYRKTSQWKTNILYRDQFMRILTLSHFLAKLRCAYSC